MRRNRRPASGFLGVPGRRSPGRRLPEGLRSPESALGFPAAGWGKIYGHEKPSAPCADAKSRSCFGRGSQGRRTGGRRHRRRRAPLHLRRGARRAAGRPRPAWRLSGARWRLRLLPHGGLDALRRVCRRDRPRLRRRPRDLDPLRRPRVAEHHAGQGDRHRNMDRRRLLADAASRDQQARRAALPGDALRVLHQGDARGFGRDLRLPQVAEAGQARRRRQPPELALRHALRRDDGVADAVVHAGRLSAERVEDRGVESRRLSRRGSRPLRRLPHAAQFHGRGRARRALHRRAGRQLVRAEHHAELALGRRRLHGRSTRRVLQKRRHDPHGRAVRRRGQRARLLGQDVSRRASERGRADGRGLAQQPALPDRSGREGDGDLSRVPAGGDLAARSGPACAVQPYRLSVGARLFVEDCAGCHMPNGSGAIGAAPPLAGNPMVIAPSPDNLLSMVLGGQVGQHRMGPMPSFTALFTNAEIAATLSYVRASWGNAASPVTPDEVALFRRKYFPGQAPNGGGSGRVEPGPATRPPRRSGRAASRTAPRARSAPSGRNGRRRAAASGRSTRAASASSPAG